MVRRFNSNWMGYWIDVYTYMKYKYSEKSAQKFISHFWDRYGHLGVVHINFKFAIMLYDEYLACKRMGTRFYAAIGIGGAGKTTLLKNVMYFLDETIENNSKNRISVSMIEYLKQIKQLPKSKGYAAFMDEPDDAISGISKIGKDIRKVYGKGRQHGIFSGICATDVTDIPPFIWKKIHVLFFLPTWGQVWVFSNNPKQLRFPIQRIKQDIMKYGYDLLVSMRSQANIFPTYKHTALDSEIDEYERTKWLDYQNDLDKVLMVNHQEEEKVEKKINSNKWKNDPSKIISSANNLVIYK